MAKYGSVYLNSGEFRGARIIPAEWVAETLAPSSFNTYGGWVPSIPDGRILAHFDTLDYGYLWWSSKSGSHPIQFAWGHGGQLIILVPDLNMIVVTSADYLPGQFGEAAWQKTKAIMELAGGFIAAVN
jgi:CubicO group peptidase (beta-lactamase class C family)